MKSILGIGNALVDILASPQTDDMLSKYALPKGSMQHVDETKSNRVLEDLQRLGCQRVAGGSAANTINGAARLGMRAGFLGKIGDDELGRFFAEDQRVNSIAPELLKGQSGTGRAMVIISPDSERTFAVYLGAAIELTPEDIRPELFEGYDYLHIEGYLVQNHALLQKAVQVARDKKMLVSLDMASYNVVAENKEFLMSLLCSNVDIVFANEDEAMTFTGKGPEEAVAELASMCGIAVVKTGSDGSWVQQGAQRLHIPSVKTQAVDCTGAGDLYAAGFLFGLAKGKSPAICAQIGTLCASNVIQVIGPKMNDQRWGTIQIEINKLIES